MLHYRYALQLQLELPPLAGSKLIDTSLSSSLAEGDRVIGVVLLCAHPRNALYVENGLLCAHYVDQKWAVGGFFGPISPFWGP